MFWSEQYITSGLAAVQQATITLFGLVLAWIFLPSERITKRKIVAVVIGMIGVGVVFVSINCGLRIAGLCRLRSRYRAVRYCTAPAFDHVGQAGDIHPAALLFCRCCVDCR